MCGLAKLNSLIRVALPWIWLVFIRASDTLARPPSTAGVNV